MTLGPGPPPTPPAKAAPWRLSLRGAAPGLRHGRLLAVAILAAALLATVGGWSIAGAYVDERAESRFDTEVQRLETAILHRMASYEQVLRGGQGLFAADEHVSREDWRAYVEAQRLERDYPGIQGTGWSVVVPRERLAEHEAAVRAEGFPSYEVYPEGDRDPYTAIVYLEPFEGRNLRAFGFDMFQEPVRREAMARSRDTGEAALSGRVTLVQETQEDVQAGFLMYLPVYREGAPQATPEERREALVGWVYSPFRARDLMQGILGAGEPDVTFEIFDGPARDRGALLHEADGDGQLLSEAERRPLHQRSGTLEIAGRPWTLAYASTPHFEAATADQLPALVLAGGTALSFLLFGIVWSLATTRERAVGLAEEMTLQLRESEAAKGRLAEDLARSNEDLQQFAYVASHDLQEPLRMVSSYVELLDRRYRGRLDPDADKYIGYAVEGAARMHTLTNDLLEYSRVGTRAVAPEPVDAGQALDAALSNVRKAIEETGARVTRDPMPRVLADPAQLARVFQNLVGNAIKYRGDAPPEVHVGARRDGDQWVLSVADNGIGIDPQYFPRLFVMFSRLHGRDKYPGSGMGLAICKRIVQRLGGRIWVESVPGRGTTFHFTLPAAPGPAPGQAEAAQAPAAGAAGRAPA